MKTARIMGLAFCLMAAGFLLGLGLWIPRTLAFARHAYRAEGRIIDFVSGNAGTVGTKLPGLYPIIEFPDQNGNRILFRSNATVSGGVAFGQSVAVRYLPENPVDAREGDFLSIWLGPLLSALFVAVFGGVGALLLRFGFQDRIAEKKARAYGREIIARVTRVDRNPSLSMNGVSPYRITAQWLDPDSGEIHVFTSASIWFDPAAFVGGEVRVKAHLRDLRKYWMDVSFLPKVAA